MQIINMKLSEIHPYEKNPRFNDGAVGGYFNADFAEEFSHRMA